MSVLAVVSTDSPIPRLEKFLATKEGWLNNVAENVWAAIRKGNDALVWECDEKSEHATWYFGRAEGSLLSRGKYLFWYGIEDAQQVAQLIDQFNRGELPEVTKSTLRNTLAGQDYSESPPLNKFEHTQPVHTDDECTLQQAIQQIPIPLFEKQQTINPPTSLSSEPEATRAKLSSS